uniref:Putative Nitrilase/cyanide hydratase and apolipoprotein N-acyltransferase n=1 Tax=mine drainage metagenome TaxID=410659 RepID=E6Q2A8_9ZZZZ
MPFAVLSELERRRVRKTLLRVRELLEQAAALARKRRS